MPQFRAALCAFALFFALIGAAPAQAVGAQGPMAQGDLPGPGTQGVHAVRTVEEWTKFQRERGLNWNIAIDFNRDMVVAVFLGTRNSAGYKVEIAEIRAEPYHTEITYREIPPAATAPVAQMLTNPYVIAVMEQPQTPVMFSKGFFSTMEVPYGEFTRLVRYMSETDYQLQDERRLKDLAEGRVRDLTDLITHGGGTVPAQ